ncbi:MAG: hypothetical protein AB9872_14895 [Solidesulfovibrio sp.]
MQLHYLNIPFDRLALPTDQETTALRKLLDVLLGPAPNERRHIAIYGMGTTGQYVYQRLIETYPHDVRAYDLRGAQACKSIPIRYASQLGYPPQLHADNQGPLYPAVVINTAPPRYVLTATTRIEKAVLNADLILWYDPFNYIENANDAYDLYFDTLQPQLTETVKHLAESIQAHYLASVERKWQNAASFMHFEKLASSTEEDKRDLGMYLDQSLSEILHYEERGTPKEQLEGKVLRLMELAARFPFFTIALDAAACLLVQHNQLHRAVAVFAPAAQRYPHCHRTLAKLAELHLMTGDRDGARLLSSRAAPLVSAHSQIRQEYMELPDQSKEKILHKWRTRALRPPRRQRNTTLHCATPVWGKPFIDLFMRVTLRSLFAPGNLPFASAQTNVRFTLYTDAEDVAIIQSYPEWQRLNELVDVRIEHIDPIIAQSAKQGGNRYDRMSRCQDHALQTSRKEKMVTFFPLADLIFSSNFLQRGLDLLNAGYDTIFFAGMRYSKERILQNVIPRLSQDLCIIAPAEELFSYAIDAVHPVYRKKMHGDHVEMHPNSFYSTDGNGNILQHFFAATPMFIAPLEASVSIAATLDADLGYSVTDGGLGNFYYITDTEQLLLLELTSESADTGELQIPGSCPMAACANWLQHNIDPLNKLLGAHTVILRQKSGSKQSKEARQLSQKVYGLLI